MKTTYLFEADYGFEGKRMYLVQSTSRFAAQILLEKEHVLVANIELIESFDHIITNGVEYMDSTLEEYTNASIKASGVDTNLISDGYHTFGELYEFRKVFNAALFNEWASQKKYNVHKSIRHNDGKYCFDSGGEWFIVVADLPTGQISNHYQIKDWDLFKCRATDRALLPFDGHTAADVLKRLSSLEAPNG